MLMNYEKMVYTALLGKIIGVFLGKPFEGSSKEDILKRHGSINRYVHDELDYPLIAVDDDISGTLLFIQSLADSGEYENTPDAFYGDTWLNYLLENKTVLWWGGCSHSTENTAYLRLKSGVRSPQSGSIALNGKEVAEQIGAQIFIDAFGMVAPGNPALAARLAKKAASVSHDGEAVYAAMVIAAMVSSAFNEHDMDALLDAGVSVIPEDSLIAKIHRDVRARVKLDCDWEKTFEYIRETYGYKKFGGNCHVVPNHAAMVMAWAYGQNDFMKTAEIINTLGWDTDCNSGNVLCVTALTCGLEHICDRYDFITPVSDRVKVSSADGTFATMDILRHAYRIAAIGRKVMHWEELPAPKDGAIHHFTQPLSRQGYVPVQGVEISNPSGGTLHLVFHADEKQSASVRNAVCIPNKEKGSYNSVSTPELYGGMTVTLRGTCKTLVGNAFLRIFAATDSSEISSERFLLQAGENFEFAWTLPEEMFPVMSFGIRMESDGEANGELLLDRVTYHGHAVIPRAESTVFGNGWISSMSLIRNEFSNDSLPIHYFGANMDIGYHVTGNRLWKDCTMDTVFQVHAADECGIVLRWQGCERMYKIEFTHESLRIVREYYGTEVLAETAFHAEENHPYKIHASVKGSTLSVCVEGGPTLSCTDGKILSGGTGFFAHMGVFGICETEIHA